MMQRTKRSLITQFGLALLGLLVLFGIWQILIRTLDNPAADSSTEKQLDPAVLDKKLFTAIRDGDKAQVRELLQLGAKVSNRDESGDTVVMRAALHADAEMMRILLEAGADGLARSSDNTPPLLRTHHDIEKMRLLLDRGATVDDFAMLAAASVPGCQEALKLLVAHGGKANPSAPAYTPLMAAPGTGDLDAVNYLLSIGANVKVQTPPGFTALIAGALSGNPRVVATLLEKGAEVNVVAKLERGILQTPVGVAASMGHAECLKLLLSAGADVNVQGGPFNHCALLGAATTPSQETMKILLTKADIAATDWTGRTALDWAERSGDTEIVRMLRQVSGAKKGDGAVKPSPVPAINIPVDETAIRKAITRALPPLQQSEQKITETRSCVSCHQHGLVSMVVGMARKRGLPVNEKIAGDERAYMIKDMRVRHRSLLLGTGIDPTLSAHVLIGLSAEGEPPSRVTDALVHYLVLRQRKEGRWQQENYRPPDEASDFQFTALAIRGLQAYASKGRKQEIAAHIERAREWLERTPTGDVVDKGFQLLGLGWSQAAPEVIQKAVQSLLKEQREEGGWSQLPTLDSDAYATGLALYALHEAGGLGVDQPSYKRGLEFLVRTQKADGSWFVASRSFPFVEYSTSGFPHGRDQFISASATCWATMALMQSIPVVDSKK